MASILDEYEDSQNTRKSAQQQKRLSNTNIGIPHTGEPPLLRFYILEGAMAIKT